MLLHESPENLPSLRITRWTSCIFQQDWHRFIFLASSDETVIAKLQPEQSWRWILYRNFHHAYVSVCFRLRRCNCLADKEQDIQRIQRIVLNFIVCVWRGRSARWFTEKRIFTATLRWHGCHSGVQDAIVLSQTTGYLSQQQCRTLRESITSRPAEATVDDRCRQHGRMPWELIDFCRPRPNSRQWLVHCLVTGRTSVDELGARDRYDLWIQSLNRLFALCWFSQSIHC